MKSGKSTRSSRRATPRGGTKTKKTSSAGLDIMERDLKREKIKKRVLSLELERVKRENERLHKKRDDAINVGVFDTKHRFKSWYRWKIYIVKKVVRCRKMKSTGGGEAASSCKHQVYVQNRQGLKSRLRDCELKVDVLKEELAGTSVLRFAGGTRDGSQRVVNVNYWGKTLRPKTREELVRELKAIDQKKRFELRKRNKVCRGKKRLGKGKIDVTKPEQWKCCEQRQHWRDETLRKRLPN